MSITEQLMTGEPQSFPALEASGLALAVVTNISDPESLGRIKCRPVLAGEEDSETDWCYCLAPAAGAGYGVFFFPNINDLVLIGFLGGDIHSPVVLGSYWAGTVKPPYEIKDGKNEVISVKTPNGSEIKLDDVNDKCKITIKTPSGATVSIDDENKSVEVKGDADNSLKLDFGKGEVELKAKSKITLSAGGTKLSIESSGAINGSSSKEIILDSSKIELKSKAAFKAEGATAEVAGKGEAKLTASGMVTIKGGITKIN